VDRAAELAPELLVALGERGHGKTASSAAAAADRRARAFTLLVDAYDACRRAVTYLRWNEGDADLIAPSLFKLRGPRRSPAEAPPEPPAPAPAPEPAPVAMASSTPPNTTSH
jgi:hypothetical protein